MQKRLHLHLRSTQLNLTQKSASVDILVAKANVVACLSTVPSLPDRFYLAYFNMHCTSLLSSVVTIKHSDGNITRALRFHFLFTLHEGHWPLSTFTDLHV